MQNRLFARGLALTSIGAILVGAAVAAPAAADPAADQYGQLRIFGSDTTQDVMQGLANAVNAAADENLLANYLAVGSSTVQIDAGGTVAPRANGSSAGRDFLRVAIGQTATANVARQVGGSIAVGADAIGKIDVARSSSGPGAAAAANGVLAYVPFAKDALTMAVKDGSPLAVVPWYIGKGEDTTSKPNLTAVYKGAVKYAYVAGSAGSYTYVGVGPDATLPVDAPEGTVAYQLRPVVPQSGSGTRSYFIVDVLGLADNNTSIPADIRSASIVIDGTTYSVQEHDGTVMGLDETVIGPFSIGQYVAFTNDAPGVTDRRNGAVLLPLKATEAGVAAAPFVTVGDGPLVKANPAFTAATRNVFNIVPSRLLDDPSTLIHEVFYGSTSLLCEQTATIELYGFLPIGSECGDDSIRAYAPTADNTSTVTWTPPTAIEVGASTSVEVVVDSKVHRQGGTVRILNGDTVVGQAAVAPHVATATATVQVPVTVTTDATSASLRAVFIPTLPGIVGSQTAVASVPVSAPTASFVSTKSTATIGGVMTVVGWVTGAEGGTVELWDGATRLQTYTLDEGENGFGFRVTAAKLSYAFQVRYVPPTGSNLAPSSSVERPVTVAKATPTIKASAATVSAGTRGKVKVTVAAINGVTPTGRVEVYRGSTRVGSGTLSRGAVTITLSSIPRGTHTLSVRYLGDTKFNAVRTTARFVVR
ncbi:MAG: Ig-like domain repeat protein [Yonghaparkia sp.]|nr:Ig-like domain repeat protein [Microcella sp.]